VPLNLTALLATVIDCATRKIVGWAMDDNYKTPLIISAIEMAARNLDLPDGTVFHSDRGSNYTSGTFAAALRRLGISQSVGRTGICYDNALSERRQRVTESRAGSPHCLPDPPTCPERHCAVD
jgi:transposase InsO family protein